MDYKTDFRAPPHPLAISVLTIPSLHFRPHPLAPPAPSPPPRLSPGCFGKFGRPGGALFTRLGTAAPGHVSARAAAWRGGDREIGHCQREAGVRATRAHVSAPRPGARGPGPGRPWRAGGPGGVLDARYSPSAVAIVLDELGAAAETRGSGKEEGSERLTGRGREARGTDTPPAARRHPERRSVPELRRNPGCRCPPG